MARGKRKGQGEGLRKWREEQKLLKASGTTAESSSSDPREESVPEEDTAPEADTAPVDENPAKDNAVIFGEAAG